MKNKKILIIDDDEIFDEVITEYLLLKGFKVAVATDGLSGVNMHESFRPDLILLDVILPEMNGVKVAEVIRSKDKITPIIFISGSENTDEAQLRSFYSGGNDHLEKGFHLDVLYCKITDRLNSRIIPENNIFQFKLGKELVEISDTLLTFNGLYIKLLVRESKLLKSFFNHPNQAISREKLIESVWKFWSKSNDHMLSNYIRNIKQKLEPLNHFLDIQPVYGTGYILLTYDPKQEKKKHK